MKKRLLIVGGHGSGEIAMSVFEDANTVTNEWQIEGFLSDVKSPGEFLGKHKIIGSTKQTKEFVDKGYYIHYTLHMNAKNKEQRINDFKNLKIPLEANATAIHPQAYINPNSEIGYGVLILPFCATSFGPQLRNYIHVYTNGFIGHDSYISSYTTIAAHSVVGGRVFLDEGVHIGLNCSIREDVKIGKYSIVGMGSVVISDFDDNSVIVGNPAKLLKKCRNV